MAMRAFFKNSGSVAFAALLLLSVAAIADTQTYKGLLIPNSREVPMSVAITIDHVGSTLKGRFTSLPPFVGEGVFLANVKNVHQCDFTTEIGAGRTLAFDGYCLTNTIEGPYTLRLPDGSKQTGHLQVKREESTKSGVDKGTPTAVEPLFTVTSCLNANSSCLAACPHSNYNAEFICSNHCRQKLVACKTKANSASAAHGHRTFRTRPCSANAIARRDGVVAWRAPLSFAERAKPLWLAFQLHARVRREDRLERRRSKTGRR